MRRGSNVQLAPRRDRKTKAAALMANIHALVSALAGSAAHQAVNNRNVAVVVVKVAWIKREMLHRFVNAVDE